MIYLDYAAASPVVPEYMAFFNQTAALPLVNSESVHLMGRQTRDAVAMAEKELISAMTPEWKCGHALFTASGTDAINLIRAVNFQPGEALFSAMEHPAVEAFVKHSGLTPKKIAYFKNKEDLYRGISGQTRLIFLTHVQSEVGIIADIDSLCREIRQIAPNAVIAADCVQSAGKLKMPVLPDIIIFSGHKLGAAGGAALLVNPESKVKLDWNSVRSINYFVGRQEPVPVIAMAKLIADRIHYLEQNMKHVERLNIFIREHLPYGVIATVPLQQASPYILHLRTIGKQGAIIARMLSNSGIMISASSACQAEAGGPSRALNAMGIRGEAAYEGIRVSFAPQSSMEECRAFIDALQCAIENY